MANRFHGAGARPDFVPIRGWEKTDLVGLVAATEGLADLVEDVGEYALDSLEAAQSRFRRWGGSDPRGLTLDEAAAFNLYTKGNVLHPERSLYAVLNRTCNELDRRLLLPFFLYLKLFFTGARKMKNACPYQLFRAFPNRPDDWQQTYAIGNTLQWWGFSSTTKTSAVLLNDAFFGTDGERTLFMLNCINGIDLSPYSDYPEAEVLLLPGAQFEVTQQMEPEMLGGAAMIAMRQVESRHDILTFEPPEPEPHGPQEPEPEGAAPIKSLAALARATDETEADLLDYSAEELAELFGFMSVDILGKKKIKREMDLLRRLLAESKPPAPQPAPQPQPQPQLQPQPQTKNL